MNKLIKTAAFCAGAMLVSHSVQAQSTLVPNDLYMGFQNLYGGGSADYIVNLGSASGLITGHSGAVVNLSSDFSMTDFTSSGLDGTNPPSTEATIEGGVVGGAGGSPADIYATQFRSGGAGTASVAGSHAPTGMSRSQDIETYNDLTQLNAPAAGNGVLDGGLSWQNYVEPANSASTFIGVSGINPDSSVTTSSVVYEDLWATSSGGSIQPFTYQGYFTIDFTGSSPDVTFTPAPEPSSYILSGAGGILVLLLRNRLGRKNA